MEKTFEHEIIVDISNYINNTTGFPYVWVMEKAYAGEKPEGSLRCLVKLQLPWPPNMAPDKIISAEAVEAPHD